MPRPVTSMNGKLFLGASSACARLCVQLCVWPLFDMCGCTLTPARAHTRNHPRCGAPVAPPGPGGPRCGAGPLAVGGGGARTRPAEVKGHRVIVRWAGFQTRDRGTQHAANL